jgi:hypothetical protein
MERIERKYPKAINCFGCFDTGTKKCSECKFAYPCYRFEPSLRGDDFKPGKYREGFGRPARSVRERK